MTRLCMILLVSALLQPGCTNPKPSAPLAAEASPPPAKAEDAGQPPGAPDQKATPPGRPASLQEITLPPGFHIDYFAEDVPGARSLTRSPVTGTVYVGSRKTPNVYALMDADGDGRAEKVVKVATNLSTPNGVAWHKGDLYVAEISRILKFKDIDTTLEDSPVPEVVMDTLPSDQHHGWKFIAFGPDQKLYVPVGAPCNVCEKKDPVYSSITRMNPDGSGFEVFAHGIRNTVGFSWHPVTKELWFTDNGRDNLGDDVPPDELNRAPKAGLHFGFPYCHGGDIPDPEFGTKRPCGEFTPPVQKLGPHVAALGMRFYTGKTWPERYHNQVFIAEHGSWNRTDPIGYRVTTVIIDEAGKSTYEVFAKGWLRPDGKKLGRPVDVMVLPDGSMLLSDDMKGAVYRIWYAP